MVVFTGLFTAFGRLVGAVASMAIAWSAIVLFGRVPQSKQTALAFIAPGSVVWPVAILGALVPAVGNLLISSVPRTPVIQISWLEWAMIGLAAFLPLGVGLATVALVPAKVRSTGPAVLVQLLRGYPYTVVFAVVVVFLGIWGLVRKIHGLRNDWESAHIPMIVKPGRYNEVVADIESALREGGFAVTRSRAAPWLALPPRLIATLGGDAVKDSIPTELVELRGDDLGILVYPFDVALLGRKESVTRARATIARRLAIAEAYLTPAKESEELEDRLAEISRKPQASADFAPIDELLDSLDLPYDQWETVYWLRLQAEQDRRSRGSTRSAETAERVPATSPGGPVVGAASSSR